MPRHPCLFGEMVGYSSVILGQVTALDKGRGNTEWHSNELQNISCSIRLG